VNNANRVDQDRLRECLELAVAARGHTSPNPMVGCLVVSRDGDVVGRGYHRRCGGPHAERLALDEAGDRARGGTLYVNVEPCCHHGHTPPCTDAVIAAGIVRVVACHVDPDSRVAGGGFEQLREAGVEIDVGLLAEDATELNAGYLMVKSTGRVFVTGKAALSLDGRMGTRLRESQWISGPDSRHYAHELRAAHDVVMVGVGTVLADDPRLTARVEAGAGPRFRVVVDSMLRTPVDARLFSEAESEVVVMTTDVAPDDARQALEAVGAQILTVEADRRGRVDVCDAMRRLTGLGVSTCLLEGGSALLTSSFDAGIIDRVVLFYAPMLIGGDGALPLWGGEGTAELGAAPRLRRLQTREFGSDRVVEGYLRLPPPFE